MDGEIMDGGAEEFQHALSEFTGGNQVVHCLGYDSLAIEAGPVVTVLINMFPQADKVYAFNLVGFDAFVENLMETRAEVMEKFANPAG